MTFGSEGGAVEAILISHYGPVVAKVGMLAFKRTNQTLSNLVDGTALDRDEVQGALFILLKHNLAVYERLGGRVIYNMITANVLIRAGEARMRQSATKAFGSRLAGYAVHVLMAEGRLQIKELTERLQKCKDEQNLDCKVHQTIADMLRFRYIIRVAPKDFAKGLDGLNHIACDNRRDDCDGNYLRGSDWFKPAVIPEDDEDEIGQPKKKRRLNNAAEGDPDPFWRVNHEQFSRIFRDRQISDVFASSVDPLAGYIAQAFLHRANEYDIAMSASQSRRLPMPQQRDVPSRPPTARIVAYMELIVHHNSGIFEPQESEYICNYKEAIKYLQTSIFEDVVDGTYGVGSTRIFRLLLKEKYLEQKEIEEQVMVPPKEAKRLLYTLFRDQFVQMQEVPKVDKKSRPSYFWRVDIPYVRSKCLAKIYDGLGQLIRVRLNHKKRIEGVLRRYESLVRDYPEEYQERLSESEKRLVNQYDDECGMCLAGESRLEAAIHILRGFQ